MEANSERRIEDRLRYHWPVWFAEDFNGILSQGQMVDVSSGGAAFNCYDDENSPYLNQQITTRFSVPRFGASDSFDMGNYTRTGHVCRIDNTSKFLQRIAIQFTEPLPFKPGEQAEGEAEAEQRLKAVTI